VIGGSPRALRSGAALALAILLGVTSLIPAFAQGGEPEIAARTAIVVDADTGEVLYQMNMDMPHAPASLTKILTTIVALESASPETRMTVDSYDLVGEASIGLFPGEQASLHTLLYGLMLASGNDAAMTVARSIGQLPGDTPQESINRFMDRVNTTASRLGLEDTHLKNPHGLDQDGHSTTARDLAAFTMYALNNPVFRQMISTPYFASDGREMYNVNRLLDNYPGLVGGKTGITTMAGYCLMQVAQRDGRTVIVVLMGSTPEQWYRDAEVLLDYGFAEMAANPSDPTRARIGLLTTTRIEVPAVVVSDSVGGTLQVNRISEHEAIVRASSGGNDHVFSWRWPLFSLATMIGLLAVVVNYPALMSLGAIAWDHRGRVRLPRAPIPTVRAPRGWLGMGARRQLRRRERPAAASGRLASTANVTNARGGKEDSVQGKALGSGAAEARLNAAQRHAERAIRLAQNANYHAAVDQFEMALKSQPDLDLTKVPGFWRLQPMGFIAAAKGYLRLDRNDDARALLTIVQLSFGSSPRLDSLFRRAIRTIE
jgi:serine-type D-Ala-D-Ala carboxypeptidase (penicillin-binding protein 5/6)